MNNVMMRYGRLLGVLAFLAVLIAAFEWSGIRGGIDLAYLRQQVQGQGAGGLLLFVLLFSLGNLIQIPGWLFLAAAVLALGRVSGGLVTYVAACVSCGVTFLAIRGIGGSALRRLESRLAIRILDRLDTRPVQSVFLLRLLFQTMPAVNYVLALSGIRLRQYAMGTLLGLPLPIALYCIFFDYLARALHLGA